jgi:hypothetical protein
MAIDNYRPAFDVGRIDASGNWIPLAFEDVDIYNITQSVLIETVAVDVYGHIVAGEYDSGSDDAAAGDVIELQHATYPKTARMTLQSTAILALTQNDVRTYVAENLATTETPEKAEIWATDDDEPNKEPFLLGIAIVDGDAALIPYESSKVKNLTLYLSPFGKTSEKSFVDTTQHPSTPLAIPAASGGMRALFDHWDTVPTAGTSLEDLYEDELEADLFTNDGDTAFVEYHGTFAANGNSKIVTVDLDGSTIANTTTTANNKSWQQTLSIMRSADGDLVVGSQFTVTGESPTISVTSPAGFDMSAAIPITLQADGGTAADIVAVKAKAWFIPSATPDTTAPSVPTGYSATALSDTEIELDRGTSTD